MIRIRCAVCDKPVDRWDLKESVEKDRVLTVWCHDAVDRMTLSHIDLISMSQSMIDALNEAEGVAFQHRAALAVK